MNCEYRSGYCRDCGAIRRVFRAGTNHILHLLLTICTCSLWLPVWLLVSIRFGGWRCVECGSKKVHKIR